MHPSGIVLLTMILVVNVKLAAAKSSATAQVCTTPECLALSALITTNMNQSADPCEDFNAYACGNYRMNNLYDSEDLSWAIGDNLIMIQSGVDAVLKKMKKQLFEMLFVGRPIVGEDPDISALYRLSSTFLRSCTGWLRKRNDRINPNSELETAQIFFNGVFTHLQESIESSGWTASNGSFERVLGKMARYGRSLLISVSPTFDYTYSIADDRVIPTNMTKLALKYYLWDPASTNISIYLNFFRTLSIASKVNFDNPDEFLSTARVLANNVTSAANDKYLSNWTDNLGILTNCSFRDDFLKTNKRDLLLHELDALSKCVNPSDPFSWTTFLEVFFDAKVDPNTPIEIRSPRVAVRINNLVSYLKRRSSDNSNSGRHSNGFSFLIFDWLLSFQSYFPRDLIAEWRRKPVKLGSSGPIEEVDPTSECARMTKSLLGPAVERMFQRSYHAENFDRVHELVELVQNATIKNVREAKWISNSSKAAIVDQIISVKKFVGFDEISVSDLKKLYATTILSLKSTNITASYKNFGVLTAMARCAFTGTMKILLSSSPQFFTFGETLTVNAFNFGGSRIVFPMGVLTPFFYHRSFPDYMNLGGIGTIIGHEIGHGFDTLAYELNNGGALGHIWDNRTVLGYLERMKCVLSRFGSYELVPGRLHSAVATVRNDVSDLMGIRSAFAALQLLGERGRLVRLPNLPESLTPERLFFVQAAQAYCTKAEPDALVETYATGNHSPPHIRIRGMVENSRDFAQVFQCRRGQAMNPSDKCEFW